LDCARYSKLSRADFFNADIEEIMTIGIKKKKKLFMPFSGSFLESQT